MNEYAKKNGKGILSLPLLLEFLWQGYSRYHACNIQQGVTSKMLLENLAKLIHKNVSWKSVCNAF